VDNAARLALAVFFIYQNFPQILAPEKWKNSFQQKGVKKLFFLWETVNF